MIKVKSYFEDTRQVDFSQLPNGLQVGHGFLLDTTEQGATWEYYDADGKIRETIDLHVAALNKYLENQSKGKPEPEFRPVEQNLPNTSVVRKNVQREIKTEKKQRAAPRGRKKEEELKPLPGKLHLTERIPEEIRFIRRFVNLDGKTKTKDEILRFINALQKAMLEKRIRKTSPYAQEILVVQEKLITLFNSMRVKSRIKLAPETLEQLNTIATKEKVMPEILLLKKYINLNGKTGVRDKATKLANQMRLAEKKKTITKNSAYAGALSTAYKNLVGFAKDKKIKTLLIEKAELNGLNGLLNGLDGLEFVQTVENGVRVMNSMDFVNMRFEKLGFTGKWYNLIGDPSPGFTVMVYGKPKLGKSFLCVDFAGYLAQCHGSVYYAAKEEGLDSTLQEKLKDMAAMHPNFDVANGLISVLSPYDFIFIDSVTNMGLKPEDLNELKQRWPGKSFIFIFQTTKQGDFRGAQSFMHDVDVVIEVPEKGKAVQMGRFNQGGEMNIFQAAA